MRTLYLEDLAGLTEDAIKDHIVSSYEASRSEVDKYDILVAYESVGSWGCDSSSWFLLQDIDSGELYEVHGSHCSCYGFEGQFTPEKTSVEYLNSHHFNFWHGGYDNSPEENERMTKEYLRELL